MTVQNPSQTASLSTQSTSNRTHRSNFIRFMKYVYPYRYYVVMATIGGIIKFTVPLFVPELTRHLVDEVYLNEALSAANKTSELLKYLGVMAGVFVFFWTPWTYIRHFYAGKAAQKSIFDLRHALYYRILRMSAAFFDRNKSGAIVSRLISDIELAQNLVGTALTTIWMDLIALAVILYFLTRIDTGITLVSLVTFPLYIYFFRRLNAQIRQSSHQVQEEIATMSGNLQEKIAGSKVVHAFTQEKNEEQSFDQDATRLLSMSMHRVYLQSLNITITGVLVNIAPLIVMLYGGYQVINGALTVGEIVAVGMFLGQLYTPFTRMSELNVVFANSLAALDRVFEILDEKPEIKDEPGAVQLTTCEGRVEFQDVHFVYHNPEAPGAVLHNINLVVQPGEKVALVGPSGAGKSTLVSLVPRFYDVSSGSVKIDTHDVRQLTVKSLRQQIGIVLQEPVLFSGTVLDNIRYGRPDASDEEVVEACRAANALDFIQKLPNGFFSEVGEGGTFLSGGQKQRLTIARAFLKDPKILILDEATSSLDTVSERLIQSALERLMEGRTTFIIAHRLTTIENADRIIVLDKGCIVEQGTHDELLQTEGIYQRLYS